MQQRKEWYRDKDCALWYALHGDTASVHCEVYHWNISVAARGKILIKGLQEEMAKKGALFLYTVNDNPKFSKMFGAKVLGYTEVDGKEYEVLGWELR